MSGSVQRSSGDVAEPRRKPLEKIASAAVAGLSCRVLLMEALSSNSYFCCSVSIAGSLSEQTDFRFRKTTPTR